MRFIRSRLHRQLIWPRMTISASAAIVAVVITTPDATAVVDVHDVAVVVEEGIGCGMGKTGRIVVGDDAVVR